MSTAGTFGSQHAAAIASFSDRLLESERFHMGTGKVHDAMRSLAADLRTAGIEYAIVGGMALNAHGYRRETVDVDVLVRPEALEQFKERYLGRGYLQGFTGARKSFRNTATGVGVEFLTTGEFPGDGKPKPVSFPDPRDVAIEIDGLKVVALPTLVELKLASGMTQPSRRRDLADVQDLIRVLRLQPAFADQLHPYVRDTYLMLHQELEGERSRST